MRNPLIIATALTCFPLAAQTFVVDVQNGPGTNFTSLATAAAAVPDGAVLQVRAGNYFEGLVINGKSLTLLGESGSKLFPSFFVGFHIEGLSASQTVTVCGLQVDFTQAVDPTIYCTNNQGQVVLEEVSTTGRANIRATNCASLQVRDSDLGVTPFTQGVGSLVLNNCVAAFVNCSAVDVRLTNSAVQFADCALSGATFFTAVTGPAITISGGELRLLGGSLVGANGTAAAQGQAIVGNGTVRLEPSTTVTAGTPLYDPGVAVTTVTMPKVVSERVNSGADVQATMTGSPGDLGVLFLALASPATPLPGLDPLWIDSATAGVQVLGVHSGTPLQSTFALPPSSMFPGLLLTWQGLDLTSTGGLRLSNPTTHVLD